MRRFSLISWAALAAAAIHPTTDLTGIQNLLKRRLPQHASNFEFAIVNATNATAELERVNDDYEVYSTINGKILVQGNSVSGLLYGLNAYLSSEAHVSTWWFIGSQLDQAPQKLPTLSRPLTGSSVVPYRYYLNTVTTSYTMAFWDWDDWSQHLDWMALRGVNIALAWTGFEYLYRDVFKDMGFSDADLEDFLSGPAFQAWNRFGNIQGSWGGSFPTSWADDQHALQLKIVGRMTELGMTPILPAFPGFTPRAITELYPTANVSNGSTWESFPVQYTNDMFLNPLDPLFAELQDKFITKQKSYYGNVTNFYTLDQFNENSPASGDLDYLESISSNTWKSLKAASADAIWVMQGWLFSSNSAFWTNEKVEAFLGGVTVDSDMLILDLFSESQPQWQRTSSFYGKPWIWCELHGYGGNYGLYGQIMNITENSIAAVDNSSNSIVGFGLTMEGLEGNEIMYDLLLDQAWSETPIDTETYFYDWVSVRYGASGTHLSSDVFDAWELLRPTVFNNTNLIASAVPKSIFELLPSTTGLLNRTGHHPTMLNYDPAVVVAAWKLLYKAGINEPKLFANPTYEYDLVDWTRQVFGNAFIPVYEELIALYNQTSSSAGAVQNQGKKLIALLSTLDLVLDTNEHFRLGSWVEAARATTDSSHADFLEYDAKNQITLWGPSGQVNDYASKSWSGLVKTYYIPRWQKFIDYLVATPPSSYNQTSFNVDLLAWELTWVNQTTGDSATPSSRDTLQAVLATAIRSWESIFSA